MAKYSFNSVERFTVYITYGEKCYICAAPVDLQSMQVDHIIPESLGSVAVSSSAVEIQR